MKKQLYTTSVIALILVCLSSVHLFSQTEDRDVIVFRDGTQIVGTIVDAASRDFVIIRGEDGVEYSFYRPGIRMIVKESELALYDYGDIQPEVNLYINYGYTFSGWYENSYGARAGYLFPAGFSLGVSVKFSMGDTRDGFSVIKTDEPRIYHMRIREQTRVESYYINLEYVSRADRLRLRGLLSFGMSVLHTTISDPYDSGRDLFFPEEWWLPKSGTRNLYEMPLGLSIEYLAGNNILFGIHGQFRVILEREVIDSFRPGNYRTFIQNSNSAIASINFNLGYRIGI